MRRIEELINIPQYVSRYFNGLQGKTLASGEISINCPFHQDKHSSFCINPTTGLWKCYVPDCKGYQGGNLLQLVAAMEGIDTKDAYKKILKECGIEVDNKPAPKELCEDKISEYHLALLGEKPVIDYLNTKYCYTNETIIKFKLGWNGSRITIPIYDHTGKLVNIRKKPLDNGHCMGIEFYNQMRLFPISNLEGETIYLFEGEKDCMLACQIGLNAMTVTSGAGSFNQEWLPLFKDKKIVVCYDIDAAGRAGAERIKDMLLNAVSELKIIHLPITTPPNGDFTDYILAGGTLESFLELVANTNVEEKVITQNTRIPDFVYDTELSAAANAEFFYKRVRFNIVVSGKDTQPYLPPAEIEITCPANQPYCKYCGMARYGGSYVLKLNELSSDILQWIDCTEDHHRTLIQKNLEIPLKCKLWKVFTAKAQIVTEVTLIPEISYASHDTEYVVRTAYIIGKSVKANCSYRLEAITMPHPTDQKATHLIYKISENKTAIDEFEMTEKLIAKLGVFKV